MSWRFKICTKCQIRKYRGRFSKSALCRDGLNYWCKVCIQQNARKYLKTKSAQSRLSHAALRFGILTHYSRGTPKCACCGIQILEFLSMDHIKGGGVKHKKLFVHLYRWLKKNDFPKGFRVLCHNCNQSLGAYGYCPHNHDS